MNLVGYAFPWDVVGDDGALARLLEWRPDRVALAVSYHGARLPTPLHPTHRILEIPHSAFYLPVRDEAWAGRALRPEPATWLDSPPRTLEMARDLRREGLDVDAWVVLCHVDPLDARGAPFRVRNAFGDLYSHALCPAWPEVREYAATLVEEILAAGAFSGLVLEAAGTVGVEHGALHDKVEFANWSDTDLALLSLCFCDACSELLHSRGMNPTELAARVREGVGRQEIHVDDVVGHDLERLRHHRLDLVSNLLRTCLEVVSGVDAPCRVSVHASGDPWATGSFVPLEKGGLVNSLDVVVASGWSDAKRTELIDAARQLRETGLLGAYLRLDRGWPGGSVAQALRDLRDAGVGELHLYHSGLWTDAHWRLAHEIAREARSLS